MPQASAHWFIRPSIFAAIGAVNTAIDYMAFWALISFFAVSPLIANIVSVSLSAANSFAMNSMITFRDRGNDISSRTRVKRFVVITLLCLAVSTAMVAIFVPIMHPLLAKSASIFVTFAVGYFLNSRFVFQIQRTKQNAEDVDPGGCESSRLTEECPL